MNRPASAYLDLNTPEQQCQAAALLRWPWSPQVLHELTTYYRSMEDVTTTARLEEILTDLFGHAPSVLVDVQRELGGITFPYRRNHTLDFDISVTAGLVEETKSFWFAWEDAAMPIWSIDAEGQIFDGQWVYASAQQCIEWHVATRLFTMRVRMTPWYVQAVEVRRKPFEELKPSLMVFAESLGLELDLLLTDHQNLLWTSEETRLAVHRVGDDGVEVSLSTEQLAAAEQFSGWCAANGTSTSTRERIEPYTGDGV